MTVFIVSLVGSEFTMPSMTTSPTGTSSPIGTLIAAFTPRQPIFAKPALIGTWTLQIIAAVILAQTLFFKFTAAPEPVYIFTTLGAEPWGRIGSGVAELITAILLLTPRTAVLGAIMALGTMAGAIASHLGPLGIVIVVNGESDQGLLFALAWVVTIASVGILIIRRAQFSSMLFNLRAVVSPGVSRT